MTTLFGDKFRNRRVLVTGHTGFKGSWLCLWLRQLGAEVFGYSLAPPTRPAHYELLDLGIREQIGNILDLPLLKSAFHQFQPEIVFHLAAQSLVRTSYDQPIETYSTNIMGSLNVYEAARSCESVRAIVNVTTDKVYKNLERDRGYSEEDVLGGFDPYSSSKACVELITDSYRASYFHRVLIATARAGNVIGGGDWSANRLLPDMARATAESKKVILRNPASVRPWEHVLEPLSGYLLLGQKLLDQNKEFGEAWNFGPLETDRWTVGEVANYLKEIWPDFDYEIARDSDTWKHETKLLALDCTKSRERMGWCPVWDVQTALRTTAQWYDQYQSKKSIQSLKNIDSYVAAARAAKICWAT